MDKADRRYDELVLALTESQSLLYSYIFIQVGNDDLARDILQDTNLSIWKNLSHLDSPKNFIPWAKTLAALEIRHAFTRRRRDAAKVFFDSETAEELSQTLSAPKEEAEAFEAIDYQALKTCFSRLPPDKRDLIFNRYWKKEHVEDMANRMRVPFSTLAMRLLRIRKEIGDCIRRLLCRFGEEPAPRPDELSKASLFERVFEGDPHSGHELGHSLHQDPSLRREWLGIGSVHAALTFHIEKLYLAFIASQPLPQPRASGARLLKLAAGLALLLAGIASAVLFAVPAHPSAPAPVKMVEAVPVSSLAEVPAPSMKADPSPAASVQTAEALALLSAQKSVAILPAAPAISKEPAVVSTAATNTKGESEMKQTTKTVRLAAAVTAVTVAAVTATVSQASSLLTAQAGARVVIDPAMQSVYWQTVFTNRVPICWEICPAATAAELTANSLSGSSITESFTASDASAAWNLPAGNNEELYTLVLRYMDDQAAVLLTLTSRVARVKGVACQPGPVDFTAEPIDNTSYTSWNRMRRPGATLENAVIAYDAADFGATNAVASVTFTATPKERHDLSRSQTFEGVSGYIGWKVTGEALPYGWYTLEAVFDDGTILTKDDFRSSGGTVYSFH